MITKGGMPDSGARRPGDDYEQTLDPAERRLSGAYYTPDFLVRFLVRQALGRLAGSKRDPAEILALRVLDPAMGTGRFLAAAAEFLLDAYRRACRRSGVPPCPAAPRTIVACCLYGVDTDAEAVSLARRSLTEAAGLPADLSPSARLHLVAGDALGDGFDWRARFPEVLAAQAAGFSAVIGNPPFLRERDYRRRFAEVRRSELGRRYATSKMNYWYFFAHRSLELLADGGVHSFVAPAYWPWSGSATRLIHHIRQKHFVSLFVDFGRNRVFDAVADRLSVYLLEESKGVTHPETRCVRFESGLPATALRLGLERLPAATPGITRVITRPWMEAASGGLLQLGVDLPSGPRAAAEPETTVGDIGLRVTQGIAQNPDRVTARALRAAAAHYGVSPQELLRRHQVSVGDGVFVLDEPERLDLALTAEELALLEPYYTAGQLSHRSGLPPANKWLLYSAPETSEQIRASATLIGHLARYRFLMELRRETRAGIRPWWQMHWPRRREWFRGPRLIVPQLQARPNFIYADTPGFVNLSVNVIVCPDSLTAKLLWIFLNAPRTEAYLLASAKRRGANIDIGVACLRRLPIPARFPWAEILSGAALKPAAARIVVEAFDRVRHLEQAGAARDAAGRVLADADARLRARGNH